MGGATEAQRSTEAALGARGGVRGRADWAMSTDSFVDEEMEPDPALNRITNAVIGAAIEVHRHLGPGHLEFVYEQAMVVEMTLRRMSFERQVEVQLVYKGRMVGKGRLDFLVENAVVLDLKSVEHLASIHTTQMVPYLAITGHPLGLIINFNVPALRHGIKRIAGRPQRT
jgi:GxxExxY protein